MNTQKNNENGNTPIVYTFYEKKPLDVSSSNIFDLDDLEQYGSYNHIKEFLNLPNKSIANKTLLEWFYIDEISLWWFIAPSIHAKFKEAALFINRFSNYISQHKISHLKINGHFDKIEIIHQICTKHKISFETSLNLSSSFKIKNIINNSTKSIRYKSISRNKIKKRINNIDSNFQFPKNFVLFTSPGIYRRNTLDFESNRVIREEFFLGPIMKYFSDLETPSICIDLDYTLRGTTTSLHERQNSESQWLPVEFFLQNSVDVSVSLNTFKNVIEYFKKLNPTIFEYQGVSLWDFLCPTFEEMLLTPNLPTYLSLIKNIELFFQKYKPKMIVQVYEAGPYAKCFEVVAKKFGIKTIGIQHGLIPSDYPDYMFKEIVDDNKFGNIIPDLTLVYGKYYKELLTSNGFYPSDKVLVFGHPNYFNLKKFNSNLISTNSKNKLKLNHKKIILLPLSFRLTLVKNNPDRILLNSLYENYKNHKDIVVLIRPHPGDELDNSTLSKMFPANNFLLSPQKTLIEDLLISDLITVVVGSTVASEGAIFKKPIFLIDVTRDSSIIDQVHQIMLDYKVAKLINIENLQDSIDIHFKNNSNTCSKDNQSKFLKIFFNNLDFPNFDFLKLPD